MLDFNFLIKKGKTNEVKGEKGNTDSFLEA